MQTTRRISVALVVGLVAVGGTAALWLSREPEPLPPLAVQTLDPPTGVDLPAHVVEKAYSLDAPVEATRDGNGLVTVQLDPSPALSTVGVVASNDLGSLDELTDWQRRHPEDSHVVGEPVVEHSALGLAVRKDLRMNAKITITQWAVEHDDQLYLVEWTHAPDDDTWRPTVEAMISSWRWT